MRSGSSWLDAHHNLLRGRLLLHGNQYVRYNMIPSRGGTHGTRHVSCMPEGEGRGLSTAADSSGNRPMHPTLQPSSGT